MRRLYQQVADSLKNQIVNRDFTVGQRLPAERVLADKFNVSRPTIREAIIALEIMGYVDCRIGSGVYVISNKGGASEETELDIGPFELMEARRLVESEVASMAAARIDDVQLAKLEELLTAMEQENETGKTGEEADREFHVTIAQGTHNSALVATIERYWDIRETSPMLINMLNRARSSGVRPTIAEHRRILEALQAHDPNAASAAMSAHLTSVIDGLLKVTETEAVERARNEASALRKRYQEVP